MSLLTITILMMNSTHTLQNDYTKLAETQQETAEIQEKASYDTGCSQTYQDFN